MDQGTSPLRKRNFKPASSKKNLWRVFSKSKWGTMRNIFKKSCSWWTSFCLFLQVKIQPKRGYIWHILIAHLQRFPYKYLQWSFFKKLCVDILPAMKPQAYWLLWTWRKTLWAKCIHHLSIHKFLEFYVQCYIFYFR